MPCLVLPSYLTVGWIGTYSFFAESLPTNVLTMAIHWYINNVNIGTSDILVLTSHHEWWVTHKHTPQCMFNKLVFKLILPNSASDGILLWIVLIALQSYFFADTQCRSASFAKALFSVEMKPSELAGWILSARLPVLLESSSSCGKEHCSSPASSVVISKHC